MNRTADDEEAQVLAERVGPRPRNGRVRRGQLARHAAHGELRELPDPLLPTSALLVLRPRTYLATAGPNNRHTNSVEQSPNLMKLAPPLCTWLRGSFGEGWSAGFCCTRVMCSLSLSAWPLQHHAHMAPNSLERTEHGSEYSVNENTLRAVGMIDKMSGNLSRRHQGSY